MLRIPAKGTSKSMLVMGEQCVMIRFVDHTCMHIVGSIRVSCLYIYIYIYMYYYYYYSRYDSLFTTSKRVTCSATLTLILFSTQAQVGRSLHGAAMSTEKSGRMLPGLGQRFIQRWWLESQFLGSQSQRRYPSEKTVDHCILVWFHQFCISQLFFWLKMGKWMTYII